MKCLRLARFSDCKPSDGSDDMGGGNLKVDGSMTLPVNIIVSLLSSAIKKANGRCTLICMASLPKRESITTSRTTVAYKTMF